MTLNFSLHENLEFGGGFGDYEPFPSASGRLRLPQALRDATPLFAEKLRRPQFFDHIARPRLLDLLAKSSAQIGATLIAGRAGTGKTAVAEEYAQRYDHVAWFQVEAAESDWHAFARYFAASFTDLQIPPPTAQETVATFIESIGARLAKAGGGQRLIVLDDVHNIFDADWFAEFFTILLYALPPATHLLLLARSKPAHPLWRLRSKQVLGVVDEKLLAFNVNETIELFRRYGRTADAARCAYRESFGRISRLKTLAEETGCDAADTP